ncbi:hypothetical protein ACHMXB_17745 [Arthrobacter sp. UC242_113]|uniref:hypothetical protein n=1 Tax=Arthrobacter sp. UC242_113 TaxID=3374550 RepID=UPI0037576CAD
MSNFTRHNRESRAPILVRALDRHEANRVGKARDMVARNAFSAVVTGGLVPGGRAPVIIALGLAGYPMHYFILFGAAACALWAAIYTAIGFVGGTAAGQPALGVILAVLVAAALGGVFQLARRLGLGRRG